MEFQKDNYDLLIQKLDGFIRKYYTNQIIKGALYTVGLILLLFIIANLAEYRFYFTTGVRKFIFYSFIGISLLSLYQWVLKPASHYFRLGKIITHDKAAVIIGDHFPEVKDKLLNILQLKKQSTSVAHAALISASINQKSDEIKFVPFRSAIDLTRNKKYLRFALPPLCILLAILLAAPNMITDPASRIIQNNKNFERQAPFSFHIKNGDLSVPQNESFDLDIAVDGAALPDEAFIEIDNFKYKLQKNSKNSFSYTFNNVQSDIPFKLTANGFESKPYELNVLQKPGIENFEVNLNYPAYTGKKDETLNNIGDLDIPEGTRIQWSVNTKHTDDFKIRFGDAPPISAQSTGDSKFTLNKTISSGSAYAMFLSNKAIPKPDSVRYTINVVPDLHPTISLENFNDSADARVKYFVGSASDDYGLTRITFNYRIINPDGSQGKINTTPVKNPQGRQTPYNFIFDFTKLALQPGARVEYYFEAFDNDGVHGSKSSKTEIMQLEKPTLKQVEAQTAQNNADIKDKLAKAVSETEKIKEEFNKLRDKILQEKDLNWKNKKDLENLFNRQKQLMDELEKAKQKFEENKQNQKEYEKADETLQKKEEKVQELFDKLLNEENKKMMEKIQELMDKLQKEDALKMMEDQKSDSNTKEMELDRMLELFKQLEMDHELQKQADKLNEMSEKQDKLADENNKNQKPEDQLKNEQDKLNKEFEDLSKKMDELSKKNQEMERPKDMKEMMEDMKDIKKDMEKSSDQLEQKQKKQAQKKQKDAAKKMKEAAEKMSKSMDQASADQMEEDLQSLRQLLSNLLKLSFDQEGLINNFSSVNVTVPRYNQLVQEQFRIKDNFVLVQDSLHELSKRVYQIETYVTERVNEINTQLGQTLEQLEDRNKGLAANSQQRVMKNLNDLALMLSESMQKMQDEMNNMQPGNKSCSKPGGKGSSKVPMDKITEGQQSLSEDMKKAAEKRKSQKEGKDAKQGKEGKEGENGEQKNGGNSGEAKEFAEMAARQAALKRALQELQKDAQQQGQGGNTKNLKEILDAMEKNETDLVNKRLTNEMMKRQQEILTKLLEAEKASREQEYDNKRKAETASDIKRKFPPSIEEYIKQQESETDILKKSSPSLKTYYKSLVDEYYRSTKSN